MQHSWGQGMRRDQESPGDQLGSHSRQAEGGERERARDKARERKRRKQEREREGG